MSSLAVSLRADAQWKLLLSPNKISLLLQISACPPDGSGVTAIRTRPRASWLARAGGVSAEGLLLQKRGKNPAACTDFTVWREQTDWLAAGLAVLLKVILYWFIYQRIAHKLVVLINIMKHISFTRNIFQSNYFFCFQINFFLSLVFQYFFFFLFFGLLEQQTRSFCYWELEGS